jgi:predicted nucleotidyltransferase
MAMPIPASWRIKKAILEFRLRLLRAQGDNILRIVLFGSVARNEHKEESDIDIFVLIKESDEKMPAGKKVMDVASELNVEKCSHGIYISPFIVTKAAYEENKKKELIYYNIQKDGVPLYDA